MKKIILFCCCFGLAALSLQAGARRETASRPLQVGLVPAVDALPLMLANDRGYFAEEGVDVNLVLFPNPQEMDAAVQAGHLDGAILNLLGAIFLNAGGFDYKVTSITNGRFGIVASPQSGITSLAGLKGAQVGVFLNQMIHYIVDSLLESDGVSPSEYEAVAVPNILLRLEMVLGGLLDAACLPEPLLTAAVAQGAVLLATTDNTGLESGVLVFSGKVLNNRLNEVQAFYRAYYKAAMEINADPDHFRDYLVEQAGFPPSVRDTFQFVKFTEPILPDDNQINRSLNWLTTRGLLNIELSPSDVTDSRAISEWFN